MTSNGSPDPGFPIGGSPDRWMAVGRSSHPDARTAGAQAARAALDGGIDLKLIIVFSSDSYDDAELLAGVHAEAGATGAGTTTTPLIGCSTAGEIASSGPGEAGVVVTAIGGPGFQVATSLATQASQDLRQAGSSVAEASPPASWSSTDSRRPSSAP